MSRHAYTLMELLVVIVIISILAAMSVVGITAAIRASRIQSTQQLLERLHGVVDTYRTRHGDYPPSTLSELGARNLNAVNNGGEALAACLASRRGGEILFSAPGDGYTNTDGDRTESNVTGWFFEDLTLREIADAFGGPVAYFHFREYDRTPPALIRYGPGDAVPRRDPGTGAFFSPDRFQMLSAGPDGKFGTGDDIVK